MPEPAPVIIATLSLSLMRTLQPSPADDDAIELHQSYVTTNPTQQAIPNNPPPSSPTKFSSISSAAPAHVVTLAGNKTGIIRSQKVNNRCNLFWAAQAAHGNSDGHILNLLRSDLLQDRSFDHGRRHTINVHS